MASVKFYLKIYSLSLGFVVSFASFCWMALILYVLSQTDPGSTGMQFNRHLGLRVGFRDRFSDKFSTREQEV